MKDKRKVRNTAKDAKDNPAALLGIAMVEGTSQMIECQEAAGQSSFVTSTTLPTKIMTDNGQEIMELWGIVFGEVVEDDPMFQYVTLPDGWTRAGTDHSMHSDVLDDKGRKRIGVFYKAAFYDRSAHLSLNRRYRATYDYDRFKEGEGYIGIVTDCDVIIYEADPLPGKTEDGEDNFSNYAKSQALAKAWLDEHYPEWNDPSAYWDE